jgi:tetratricopeptide (TPR) repeat protein
MCEYMSKRRLVAGLLVILLVACDRQAARMDKAAENCEKAIVVGALEVAEEQCTIALGDNDGADLKPEIRSQRLYRLGHIKRTRAKYPEAQELIAQSLAIEEARSESDSFPVGQRLLEMSLILAGQGQWDEGALFLERALPFAGQFTEKQQVTMTNVLRHFARRLEQAGRTGLAERFRSVAAELEKLQATEKTDSP